MTAHAMLLMFTVDLPARALILNMKQFNGECGCCYCEYSGLTQEGSPLVRYWPPTRPTLRTHRSLMENARVATTNGTVVCHQFIMPSCLSKEPVQYKEKLLSS